LLWSPDGALDGRAGQAGTASLVGIASDALGTKKRPFGRVMSLRSRRFSAHAAGGSANEALSHLSNLLSARDERSIEERAYRRYVGQAFGPMVGVRLLCVCALTVAAAACGQSRTHPKSLAASPTKTCATSHLAVWLGLGEGGGAAGSTYYPLEFTNVSRTTCRLFGFPGVSARRGRQVGSPAKRDRSRRARRVTLAPGGTAHAVLRIVNVDLLARANCKVVDATSLRVYPPGQTVPAAIPFRFRACSAPGPIFLFVRPVQPSVGIPGH
jgi:hypothetical protein